MYLKSLINFSFKKVAPKIILYAEILKNLPLKGKLKSFYCCFVFKRFFYRIWDIYCSHYRKAVHRQRCKNEE